VGQLLRFGNAAETGPQLLKSGLTPTVLAHRQGLCNIE
jgi:hypothetical protein